MSTRTISITDEAYERLKVKKGNGSFSDAILKITNKKKLSDFAGIWSKEKADSARKAIKRYNDEYEGDLENIRKRLSHDTRY